MSHAHEPSRRDALRLGLAAGAGLVLGRLPLRGEELSRLTRVLQLPLVTRPIPSSGEPLPVIGLGTAQSWGDTPHDQLCDLLREMPELGGKVVDTAPSYGKSEEALGDAINDQGLRSRFFLATKVSLGGGRGRGGQAAAAPDPQRGIDSLAQSMERLHTKVIDLMQVWNLGGTETLLPMLREWKTAGKIRYHGVTTSSDRQYDTLLQLMKAEKLDFIQVDYSINNRNAEEQILPLAAERGMGVLINLPFGRESVFQKSSGKPVPDWAKEIDCTSWPQIFLKWVVSHPAVTCAIPGTTKLEHLTDNLGAAHGRMPDAAMRKRIQDAYDGL